MYFVDRKKTEQTLHYIETCIETFEANSEWDSRLNKLALERLAHVLIEAIVDVGNQMIDGFIMRDPGSYDDILDILCDERVITEKDGERLKMLIDVRKELVRSYISVDHDALLELMRNCLPALKAFPVAVRRYLDEELGPVSAFLPEDEKETRG